MKLRFPFLLVAFTLVSSFALPAQGTGQPQVLPEKDLHIGKAVLHTEIASTGQEREIGLMYVAKMPDNNGMIFLMPTVGPAGFWMKNTLIPLSIAFIDQKGVVLEVHDMKAEDETPIRSESDKVAYALEANLHWFSLNGIKPGDKLDPPPAALGKPQP